MFPHSLQPFTHADWSAALDSILPNAHEVDRDATRIWSAFFPLALADAWNDASDAQALTRRLRIQGNPRLTSGQIDSSHWFLYGHRYWPVVKGAILDWAERQGSSTHGELTLVLRDLIADVATRAGVDRALVSGITFVGLMTLRQVGLDAFRASSTVAAPESTPPVTGSADALVQQRRRDDGQGPLGFLRATKRFSVTFDERRKDGRFAITESQHITTAAAEDKRDYTQGPRSFQEGPIPAQCRSATCGTCWVGVLGGREKLNEIEPYERRKLREFGYVDPQEPHPLIRLACQARAFGNVSLVIPPWHGFVSRLQSVSAEPLSAGAKT